MLIPWVEKLFEFLEKPRKMDSIEYPEFLNSDEKWTKCVNETVSVEQFEDVFYKLLDDPSVSTLDVLRIIKRFERDVYNVHGNQHIHSVVEVVDSIIRYMVSATRDFEQQLAKRKALEKAEANNIDQSNQSDATVDSTEAEVDAVVDYSGKEETECSGDSCRGKAEKKQKK